MRTFIQAIVASLVLASAVAYAAPPADAIELAPIVITAPAPSDDEALSASEGDDGDEALANVVEAQVGVESADE